MSKILKRTLAIGLPLILFTFFVLYNWGLEYWVNNNLESIINQNENRNYELRYASLELDGFSGIQLNTVELSQLNPADTRVRGTVRSIALDNINWWNLVIESRLQLGAMRFHEPAFDIVFSETQTDNNQRISRADIIQQLFTDIITRGKLSNFQLIDGRVAFRQIIDGDTLLNGSISAIGFEASGIVTDSVIFKYPIPFLMERFSAQIDTMKIAVDAYRNLEVNRITFDSKAEILSAVGASLQFNQPWMSISRQYGLQTDLVEFELDSLSITQLDAVSHLFGENIDIRAACSKIVGLDLKVYRNYQLPRPESEVKPMFEGLLAKIEFPLVADTVMVKRSSIGYTQLIETADTPGLLTFNDMYASFYNLTTIPELKQKMGYAEVDIVSKINGSGSLQARLVVPYNEASFVFDAELNNFDLGMLNSSAEPLAELRSSGTINTLKFNMQANEISASNRLDLQYENLKVTLLDDDGSGKKLFPTLFANTAIRNEHLPDTPGFEVLEYTTERNPNRSSFNFLWNSLYEGGTTIMVSKVFRNKLAKR